MRARRCLLLAGVVLVAGACADPGSGNGGSATPVESGRAASQPGNVPSPLPSRRLPTEVAVPPTTQPPAAPGAGAAPADGPAADAVRDLSARLGVPPEQVTVVRVEEVTWRDSSLGCPQPGMVYLQVLTPGTRIELSAEGRTYVYHAGDRRAAFLCERPQLGGTADE